MVVYRGCSGVESTYIFMAIHTKRFYLVHRLYIVIVVLAGAIGGWRNLISLLADGLKVVGRGDDVGRSVRVCLILGRHGDIWVV